jgi:transcriptional regulator with XRE-family HTH domain
VKGSTEVAARFAQNLVRARRRAGLSQEELGYRAGLHRTEVSLLERGARTPRADTVVKLAGSVSAPVDDLLAGLRWTPGRVEVIVGGFELVERSGAP